MVKFKNNYTLTRHGRCDFQIDFQIVPYASIHCPSITQRIFSLHEGRYVFRIGFNTPFLQSRRDDMFIDHVKKKPLQSRRDDMFIDHG